MSGCKNDFEETVSEPGKISAYDHYIPQSWHLTYSDGILSITWINVVENCCPEEIGSTLESCGDMMTTRLTGGGGMCDCMCLFDIDTHFSGIEPGIYLLTFDGGDFTETAEVDIYEGLDRTILRNNPEDNHEQAYYSTHSGCLDEEGYNKRTHETQDDSEEDPYASSWALLYENGNLKVDWHNIWGNCCPEKFYAYIDRVEGENELRFTAGIKTGFLACSCVCPYDMTGWYSHIDPGHYKITFSNIGWRDEEYSADVDIMEGTELRFSKSSSELTHTIANTGSMRYFDDTLQVAYDDEYQLEIFDASGLTRAIFHGTGVDEYILRNLPKGIFLVKLSSMEHTESMRIVR